MARMRRKAELPTKTCAACARPFAWRKKWARDWEAVKFCSDACRRLARGGGTAAPSADDAGRER
jgi:hypothetical protein